MPSLPSGRDRRVWAAVGLAVVFVAGAMGWYALLARPTPPPPADEAAGIAAGFLDRIRAGKPDDAWAATGAEFKSLQGRDAFRAYVRAHQKKLLAPTQLERAAPLPSAGLPLTECVFRPAGGGAIRVTVGTEDGIWKVARLVVE